MNRLEKNNESGVAAMILVLVLAAASISIVIASNLSSVSTGMGSLSSLEGNKTYYLAEGCVEDALLNLWANSGYSGGTLTRPEGQCSVTISQNGSNYVITVNSIGSEHSKKLRVEVSRGTQIQVISWQEI